MDVRDKVLLKWIKGSLALSKTSSVQSAGGKHWYRLQWLDSDASRGVQMHLKLLQQMCVGERSIGYSSRRNT